MTGQLIFIACKSKCKMLYQGPMLIPQAQLVLSIYYLESAIEVETCLLANRWRGENVSTLEVEATISNVLELKDATAYGVEIPNVEGRAGMTTILIKASAWRSLSQCCSSMLNLNPPYVA